MEERKSLNLLIHSSPCRKKHMNFTYAHVHIMHMCFALVKTC